MMTEIKKEKVMLFWSGGKNSAMALHYLRLDPQVEVVGLITLFSQESNTVPLHGIPDFLIMEQASMLKLPLQRLFISEKCTTEEYVKTIRDLLKKFAKTGIKTIAFGDSQNEEDKLFHEQIVHPIEIKAIFPLWNMNLEKLNHDLINSGYKALVTAIDTRKLDNSYLNCEYNLDYMNKLSDKNLIHTFVIYGPTYKTRIAFSKSIAVMEGPYLVSLIKGP